MAIDPLNSASRIKTVRETRYQISNQNVSRKGEKESFSKRDDEKRDETKKKRKKKEMEYIINEIFQDLFKLNSK